MVVYYCGTPRTQVDGSYISAYVHIPCIYCFFEQGMCTWALRGANYLSPVVTPVQKVPVSKALDSTGLIMQGLSLPHWQTTHAYE